MMRVFMCMLLVLLLLSGCSNDPNVQEHAIATPDVGERVEDQPADQDSGVQDGNTDTDREEMSDTGSEESEQAEDPKSPDLSTAYDEAGKLLDALKARDASVLAGLLEYTGQFHAIPFDQGMAENIIKGFEINFDLDSLVAEANEEGTSWLPESGQFEFILKDNGDASRFDDHENVLLVSFGENGSQVYYYNPYIRYFPFAFDMVSRYMQMIEAEDAQGLAAFLNPDDLDVPVWVAEETINQYKKFLDGASPAVRYQDKFFFVVSNGQGDEHLFQIVYGDGLTGIRDEFIPEF